MSQSTEQDNPGRLVIEAAHGSAPKVRELVQKHPDKVHVMVLQYCTDTVLKTNATYLEVSPTDRLKLNKGTR